ncbi:MAG: VTT domain-containing protein [Acidobacteria bacterium]|nr:VTT domain-containing protein [Acidobacteriota bacterium]
MHELTAKVAQYGLPFVFVNVFLEQIGLPIPAFPTLVVTGALVAIGVIGGPQLLLVAVVACVLADTAWYALGRRHGHRVLSTLCRISLSPVTCIRQTESLFERWGMRSLVVAKFVPGFSTVAPPVAGATRVGWPPFLIFDTLGAAVWAGAGIGLGMIFSGAIDRVLEFMTGLGNWALAIIAAAVASYIFIKWRERRRFHEELRQVRIGVNDLRSLMDDGQNPVILDVRSPGHRKSDPRRIPGAIGLDMRDLERTTPDLPTDREIILYCA